MTDFAYRAYMYQFNYPGFDFLTILKVQQRMDSLTLSAVFLSVTFFGVLLYETQTRVRYYVRYGVFYLTVMVFAVFLIPVALWKPGVHNARLVSLVLGPTLNFLLGLKWTLRNRENFLHEGCVIVANHQSTLDFAGMMTMWPIMERCAAIAKREIFFAGPFGVVAWLCGTIFIKREKPTSAHSVMNGAIDEVRQKRIKLWIFPEGTRNTEQDMLPFKKGAFHMAITGQLPICPVVFSRYYFLNNAKYRLDPGQAVITILPPISTEGLTLDDLPELMERTRNSMLEVYKKTSEEVTPA